MYNECQSPNGIIAMVYNYSDSCQTVLLTVDMTNC